MRWSIGFGRIFGIRFRLHVTFLLLLLFVFLAGVLEGKGAAHGTRGVLFICAVFLCVLIHELGHSLIARRFGKEVTSITLLPIGGVATMEEVPERPAHEIAMAAVGPFINLLMAGIFYLSTFGGWPGFSFPEIYPASGRDFLNGLVNINIVLAVFNMVPAFPMDGGRVLRGLLALKLDYVRATSVAVSIGQGVAMLMIFLGILGNLWLVIIGFFLYVGAGSENRAVMMRSVLRHVPASEAMTTDFNVVRSDERLPQLLERIERGCQEDFPVVGDHGIEGIVTKRALLAAINAKGTDISAAEAMDRDFLTVGVSTPLEQVYKQVFAGGKAGAAVIEDGEVKGMLCPEGLGRFLGIRLALRGLNT